MGDAATEDSAGGLTFVVLFSLFYFMIEAPKEAKREMWSTPFFEERVSDPQNVAKREEWGITLPF